jgi:hypothetical protein
MKVTQQRYVTAEAWEAITRPLYRSNLTPEDVLVILRGYGWMIWNCGNLSWVLTMANTDNEIEVLLCGGQRARECIGPWEESMLAEPAHKGKTLRIEGRKGWQRLLPHWERRDGALYRKVPE